MTQDAEMKLRCKKKIGETKEPLIFSGNLSVSDQKLGGKHVEN